MAAPLLAAIPGIISAFGSIGGAAAGAAAGSSDREAQRRLLQSILAEYGNLDVPQLEQVIAEELGPSAQEDVRGNMDPRFRNEQMGVLDSLRRLEEGGGENAETRAVLNKILGETQRSESAGRNAILNNMKARGVSGSGAELAMQLQANQGQADRAQSAGLDAAADANRRLLQSITSRGQLAGQMRSQEYGEMSDEARAKDMIRRYNADSRSRASYHNNQLPVQQFGMEMQKLAGKSNAATGAANNYGAAANSAATQGANVGAGIGYGAGSFAQEYLKRKDEEEKNGGQG